LSPLRFTLGLIPLAVPPTVAAYGLTQGWRFGLYWATVAISVAGIGLVLAARIWRQR
jgi:hypothetical protein